MEIVLLLSSQSPDLLLSSIISLTSCIVLTGPRRGVLLSAKIQFRLTQADGIRQVERAAGDGEMCLYYTITVITALSMRARRVTITAEIFTLDYISNKRQWRQMASCGGAPEEGEGPSHNATSSTHQSSQPFMCPSNNKLQL